MDGTRRIIDITVDELTNLVAELIGTRLEGIYQHIESRLNSEAYNPFNEVKQLRGIKGIALALGCSESKAKHLKAQGLLEGGYKQIGKSIIIPDAYALQDIVLMNQKKKKRKIVY